jgi:TP901 family phage tail tape measure protein
MGAGVGHDTVDAVAQALTSAMAAGFKGSPQKIVGLLDAAVGQGKMHMADITAAMNTGILPLAQLTGNSLPQILASTAALTKQGINASTVMSRMRLTFTSLVSPTAAGTKAMAALGFKNPFQLAEDMRSGGIIGMLNDLRMHTALFGGPNTTQSLNLIAQIFGKSRGIASIGSLLQAFPDIQSVYQNVLAYGNPQYLQTHFKQYQSTNAAKLAQAKANIDKGMIAFGDAINKYIVPTLGKLAEVAAKLLSGFGKLPGPLQELLLGLMALVVVGGPFFLFTGALVKGVGMIITGVAALTGMEGFGALAAGLTMTATSLALLAPAAAAAFAVFEVFTAKHGPAAKVRHVIKHAGYSAGHFLGKGIAGNLALFGIHGPESYYDVNDYLTGSAFKHLSPLLQGDVNALIGNHVSAGARLTTIERDLKQAGITSVDKIPGISDALKKAVKEGIKEVSLNVFLPNGKVLAQSVNDENRRNQNRR